MNEKILIKSKKSNKGRYFLLFFLSLLFIPIYLPLIEETPGFIIFIVLYGLIMPSLGVIAWYYSRKGELTVTSQRVYGTLSSGISVDLPLDSITAVAYSKSSIFVSTASGRIGFTFIENASEIHQIINQLLADRNKQLTTSPSISTTQPIIQQSSVADELKKYKELLDSGIITQEEFDAKKKQLLGL